MTTADLVFPRAGAHPRTRSATSPPRAIRLEPPLLALLAALAIWIVAAAATLSGLGALSQSLAPQSARPPAASAR